MKVQEALKSEDVYIFDINQPFVTQEQKFKYWEESKAEIKRLKSALSEIEKCEPVGELILDPAFLPALKAPLVNWKINLVDLEVGAKFYTSPISKEWLGLSDSAWMNIVNHDHAYESFTKEEAVHYAVKATEAKLKQLNAPEKG